MNLGVIAPSVFPVNLSTLDYGGAERAFAYFCRGIAHHAQVTLFAPKGSAVEGCKVVETIDPPRKWMKDAERLAFEVYQPHLPEFDLVSDWSHEYIPYLRREIPLCHQLCGLQTSVVGIINNPRLVALSEFHRAHTKQSFGLDSRIVPHCIDFTDYPTGPGGGPPLCFGLQAPHKGHLQAGRALGAANIDFRIAGEDRFVPDITFPGKLRAEFGDKVSGALKESDKRAALGAAPCVILNSLLPEAFSMAALEANACGTPVLMRRLGCAPEIIQEGVTGFTFENESELPVLVKRAKQLDRKEVRLAAMERYDIKPVCAQYMKEILEPAVGGAWW